MEVNIRPEHKIEDLEKWSDTPLKDELLSNSFVDCNNMVPESTAIKPQISDMMLPPL